MKLNVSSHAYAKEILVLVALSIKNDSAAAGGRFWNIDVVKMF